MRSPDYVGSLNREFISGLLLETRRFAKGNKGVTAGFVINKKPIELSKQQVNVLTLRGKGYSNAMIVTAFAIAGENREVKKNLRENEDFFDF